METKHGNCRRNSSDSGDIFCQLEMELTGATALHCQAGTIYLISKQIVRI